MAVSAITAFLPSIVSKSIFAPRRADKSIEANSTPAAIINAGIATMQLAKLGDGVVAIAKENKGNTKNLTTTLNNLASDSIFSDISKATNKITKHVSINGFIGVAAFANAMAEEDKTKALIQNGGMFGGMLLAEGAHKMLCGTVKMNGDQINKKEGLYRDYEFVRKPVDKMKLFFEKQAEAINDTGIVKRTIAKGIKHAPTIVKGISFATVSIAGSGLGYYTFGKVAEAVTGRDAA